MTRAATPCSDAKVRTASASVLASGRRPWSMYTRVTSRRSARRSTSTASASASESGPYEQATATVDPATWRSTRRTSSWSFSRAERVTTTSSLAATPTTHEEGEREHPQERQRRGRAVSRAGTDGTAALDGVLLVGGDARRR